MNTKTSINIDGIEYELDLQRAKQLGIIEKSKKIKNFEIGDLFAYEGSNNWFVIVQHGYASNTYTIIGLGDSLRPFSDCGIDGFTKCEMLDFLNSGGKKIFVKNINQEFAATAKLYIGQVKRG